MKSKRILFLSEFDSDFARQLAKGVGRYSGAHSTWEIIAERTALSDSPNKQLDLSSIDGVIWRGWPLSYEAQLLQSELPVVVTGESKEDYPFPSVCPDSEACGTLGAKHFFQSKASSFAFYRCVDSVWATKRERGFCRELERHGEQADVFTTNYYQYKADQNSEAEKKKICDWLKSLTLPCLVMTCHDWSGLRVLECCQMVGLSVPEDVMVLSVGGDEVLCALSAPSLSSVLLNPEEVGYRAARLLDKQFSGERLGSLKDYVPPICVVSRRSTHTSGDTKLNRALDFIDAHATSGVTVADVADHAGMSRSAIERAFKKVLSSTVKKEILARQLAKVKALLEDTDEELAEIARQAGFSRTSYMCTVFKRLTGETPLSYRRRRR